MIPFHLLAKLNLGCNDDILSGYINVDVAPPCDQVVNLETEVTAFGGRWIPQWPWVDSSIQEIRAHDVFEHLRDKIRAMNEAHRVLAPGGILDLTVPCVYLSDGRVNPGAFADPTHKSFWTMDDRYYFFEEWNNPRGERGRFGKHYGITALFRPRRWQLIEYGTSAERRSKIIGILEAVK